MQVGSYADVSMRRGVSGWVSAWELYIWEDVGVVLKLQLR